MPSRYEYPATVAECIDDSLRYRRGTIRAVRAFARSKPWRGRFEERARKFVTLHEELCRVYGIRVRLAILMPLAEDLSPGSSGRSSYSPRERKIRLTGRLSVVTYLHEFAHALGKGERGACRWSINLFKRYFPRSFARCDHDAHTLRRRPS